LTIDSILVLVILPLPNPPPEKWGGDYRIVGLGSAYKFQYFKLNSPSTESAAYHSEAVKPLARDAV
jgi:hypothetical protein